MAKNITELRREAGYRSGREFAAALGIAPSTYARYEQQPDSIPLRQAWAIADRLGCTIDMVVGREPVDAGAMRGDVQRFYDGLDRDSRERFDDFIDYMRFRTSRARERRDLERIREARMLLRHYERLFVIESLDDQGLADLVVFGSDDERRSAFESYLRTRGRTRSYTYVDEDGIERTRTAFWEAVHGGRETAGSPADGTAGIPDTASEEVIARIMAAYDEEHPTSGGPDPEEGITVEFGSQSE